MKAMASDWAGEEGMRIHKMVMNVPKFGNDEDYVDEIVADVFHSYLKLLPDYHTERTGKGPEVSCYTILHLMYQMVLMSMQPQTDVMPELL